MARAPLVKRGQRQGVTCSAVGVLLGLDRGNGATNVSAYARRAGLTVERYLNGNLPATIILDQAAEAFLAAHGQAMPGGFDPYQAAGGEFGNQGYNRSTHLAAYRNLVRDLSNRGAFTSAVAGPLDTLLEACAWSQDPGAKVLLMQLAEGLGAINEGKVDLLIKRGSVLRPARAKLHDIKSACGLRQERGAGAGEG
jgi:hypothetical protein